MAGVLLLGASWQQELLMAASQVCMTAQQSSWARMEPSEKHASAGAAIQRRTATHVSNAKLFRRFVIREWSHTKDHE
ncbi:hypothetical protein [Occallatibacter savannae]|uniref:hypothetical protein n=1 Tax=Occallatibacter savannae TaxID=1002691 RepID=UPI0013A56F95|nr:hypothetical protein [Occallatibacter savannae]